MTEVQPVSSQPHPNPAARRRAHTGSPGPGPRRLPPGWEKVKSAEGGVYFWHKETGKTTWKFPSFEAKEHKRMMKTHTYINIRPNHQPQVVKQNSLPQIPVAQSCSISNGTVEGELMDGIDGKRERLRRIKRNVKGTAAESRREERGGRDIPPKSRERREGERVLGVEGGGSGSSTGISAAVVEPPSTSPVGEAERGEIRNASTHEGKENSPIRPGKSEATNEAGEEKARSQSSSPTTAQMRPLLVHYYENFPFNTPSGTGSSNPTGKDDEERGGERQRVRQEMLMKPPYSLIRSASTRSGTSQRSITPPIPDRHYSMSEVNRSPTPPLPERQYLILSPSEGESSQLTSVFIPTHYGDERESHEEKLVAELNQMPAAKVEEQEEGETKAEGVDEVGTLPTVHISKRRVVTRMVSRGGDEYAVINPAWKTNVKGRSPSLTDEGENNNPSSEIPPPLPERLFDMRSPSGANMSPDGSLSGGSPGYAAIDDGIVQSKKNEMNVKSNTGGYASIDDSIIQSKQTEMNVKSNRGGYASIDDSIVQSKQTEMNVKSNRGGYASIDDSIIQSKQTEVNVKGNPGDCASIDDGLVQGKKHEMNASSKLANSVPYSNIQPLPHEGHNLRLSQPPQGKGAPRMPRHIYEEIKVLDEPVEEGELVEVDPANQDTSDDGFAVVPSSSDRSTGRQRTAVSNFKKQDRWMKTQSAHLSPSPISPNLPSPLTSPSPTSTRDATPKPSSDFSTGKMAATSPSEEEKPSLPPRTFKKDIAKQDFCNSPSNTRRLNAMNVTMRKTTEPASYSLLGLSKEALLLRSGVTLRPGMRPPSSFFAAPHSKEEGNESGGSAPSGSDEEDGLEPVNKAIKLLESSLRMNQAVAAVSAKPTGQEKSNKEEKWQTDGGIKLARTPLGPPSWKQFQRRPHNYEDIEISGSSPPELGGSDGIPQPAQLDSSHSMGHLNMAWDGSDFSAPAPQANLGAGDGARKGVVSASQPCLLDPSGVFPHLVKPDRVSDEAFKLRKLRLMQHRYEDVDIPEWPDVSVVPGSVGSVGDVDQLTVAIQNSWLDVEKEEAVTKSGTQLPQGWQVLEDEAGRPYFWHIPTGRTQYTKPTGEQTKRLSLSLDSHIQSDQSDLSTLSSSVVNSINSHRFSVRYNGSYPVEENELIPGDCVKIVHQSIRKTNASPTKGKPIFLVINGMEMQWVEPHSSSPTTVQPINRIRVWGIGLENERDFGYVARDPVIKKHKCHVFRCDRPARVIAKALLENHQKMSKPARVADGKGKENESRGESPDVPSSHERAPQQSRALTPPQLPPQPVDCERMVCVYIGSCEVPRALGIDVLNSATEKLSVNKSRWLTVSLSITPSSVQITDLKSDKVMSEHRIRFLCFLGIATDDKFCGYILESGKKDGTKKFMFHGFRMDPNTDRLCLALHNACRARYQRVLDANPEASKLAEKEAERARSKSTSSILGRLGSFKKTKKDEGSKVFIVHFLGSQPVTKSEGLDVVKGPMQQLAVPRCLSISSSSISSFSSSSPSSANSPSNLIEFEVCTAGIMLTDPQKRQFCKKKTFNVKNITYVVRIRNYFAFIARESGKYHCYIFLESDVDAATIVTTIQSLLVSEPSKQKR